METCCALVTTHVLHRGLDYRGQAIPRVRRIGVNVVGSEKRCEKARLAQMANTAASAGGPVAESDTFTQWSSRVKGRNGVSKTKMSELRIRPAMIATHRPTRRLVGQPFPSATDEIRTGGKVVDSEVGGRLAGRHAWEATAEHHETFYSAVLDRGGDHGAPIDLSDLC